MATFFVLEINQKFHLYILLKNKKAYVFDYSV